MKKTLVLAMAMGLVMALGGVAMADTNTLTVSATVVGTCRFISSTSTLAFGNLTPGGGDVNGSGSTTFWCTKGVSETITAGNGANYSSGTRNMLGPGSDLLPYTLSLTPAGVSGGPGVPRTLTIGGTVLSSDYSTKTAGAYSDTVTLTITP